MSDKSRNSSSKNQRIRIVTQCLIERKKESEIQLCILKETGNQVSLRTIYRDRKQIGREATQFFYLLAKDNDEYNQKLKNTIDSLEETLSSLKRMYKESTDVLIKIKLGELILKYEKEVYEYYRFLPVVSSAAQIKLDSDDEMKRKINIDNEGLEHQPWDLEDWLQCSSCNRWFRNEDILLWKV